MCKDNSLTFLNDLGYNVVRLPRESIDPLLVLNRGQKQLEILGPLTDLVLAASGAPPAVTRDQDAAAISGKRTDKFELKVGLKFLERLLSAMGVAGAGVDMHYQRASTVEFVYENVKSDQVFGTTIGKYLGSATPDLGSPLIDVLDEEGEAFLITETLKSNSFGTVAYDSSGTSVDVDVSGIQNAIGVSTGVSVSKDSTRKVTYQGPKFLRFGFKAFGFWVQVEQGSARFRLTPPKSSRGAVLATPAEPTTVLFGRENLLRLK